MVRGGPANRAVKRAKIFALTKGFRGRAKNCYSIAVRAAHKALQHAYRGRRLKKREMRKLWIQRINYGSREHGIGYGRFMYNLVRCNVQLNRKVLSELAIHEPRTFQALAEVAKKQNRAGLLSALDDRTIQHYQSAPPQHSHRHTPSLSPAVGEANVDSSELVHSGDRGELYQTRVVGSESGRRVVETAV